MPNYTYMVFWSPEDSEWVATCIELPGLSGLAATADQAVNELRIAIAAWMDHLNAEGLSAPAPTSGAVFHVVEGSNVRLEVNSRSETAESAYELHQIAI